MADSDDDSSCNINDSNGMTCDDFREISNIFASEFNNSYMSDRVLCFQFIEDEEINDDGESDRGSQLTEFTGHVFNAENTVETLKNENRRKLATKYGKSCQFIACILFQYAIDFRKEMRGEFGNYHICSSYLVGQNIQKAQLWMTALVESIYFLPISFLIQHEFTL